MEKQFRTANLEPASKKETLLQVAAKEPRSVRKEAAMAMMSREEWMGMGAPKT